MRVRHFVATALAAAIFAAPAHAQFLQYEGDTRGGPTFHRPEVDFSLPSFFGTSFPYQARAFHVDESGPYHILSDQTNLGLAWDGVLLVYELGFDAARPLESGHVGNDDYIGFMLPGFGIGYSGVEDTWLEAGYTYWVVQTGFSDFDAGPYRITIRGPGAINLGPGTATPAPGEEWIEVGDAGALPQTAQTPGLRGAPLKRIRGRLSSATDVDMYRLRIDEPSTLELATHGVTEADTQLWLFDHAGHGVSFNDDASGFFSLASRITGQFVVEPGEYLLAVTEWDSDALTSESEEIWLDEPWDVERRPDGPGRAEALGRWFSEGFFGFPYSIRIVGASPGCGADYNGDGAIDFFDLLDFQNDHAFGRLRADCNVDGRLDFTDFQCFLQIHGQGCP